MMTEKEMNLGLSGDEDSAEEEVAEDKALERVSSSTVWLANHELLLHTSPLKGFRRN